MPQNIYLTPNFLETQRQKGIDNNVLADFIGKNNPQIVPEVQQVRQKYGKYNNDAMKSYLDWKVYGTSQPQERFTPEQQAAPEQKGFMGRVFEDAVTGPNGVIGSAVETGKRIGQDIENAGMATREKTMKIGEDRNVAQGFVPVMGEIAWGGTKALNEPLKPVEDAVMPAILSELQKNPDMYFGPFGGAMVKMFQQNPSLLQPLVQGMAQNTEAIQKLREQNPVLADNIEGALKTASLPLAMQGAESTYNTGEKAVTGIGKGALAAGQPVSATVKAALPGAAKTSDIAPVDIKKLNKPDIEKQIADFKKSGAKVYEAEIPLEKIKTVGETRGMLTDPIKPGSTTPPPVGIYNPKTGMIEVMDGNRRIGTFESMGHSRVPMKIIDPMNKFDPKTFPMTAPSINVSSKVQKAVMPEATAKVVQDIRAKSPELVTERKFFRRGSIQPDASQKELAATANEIKGFAKAKTPVQRAQITKKSLVESSQALRKELTANNAALPKKQVMSAVRTNLAEAAKDFPGEEKVFDRMEDLVDQFVSEADGNLTGAWDARIKLYSEAEKRWGPAIFDKATAKASALKAASQTMNDVIESAAQGAGTSFKPELQRITNMYEILENLSTQGGKSVLNSQLYDIIKNPYVKAVGGTILGEEIIRRGF